MKTIKLLPILFATMVTSVATAQISEEQKTMSMGLYSALVLEIPETSEKFVSKVWKSYMNDFYDNKAKFNRKTDEWFSDNAEIASIGGSRPVDLYATVEDKGKNAYLTLWIDMGENFLSSLDYPGKFTEAEKFLMRFALEVVKESTKLELEQEKKTLKKLESELKKLEKANDRYHNTIETSKAKIEKAEKDILQNEKDQDLMTTNVSEQEEFADQVREEEDLERLELEEKTLKKLKSELKKLKSANLRLHNSIDSNTDRIRKAEKDILKNEKDQENVQKKIKDQEKVVEEVRKRLNDL